MRTRLLLVVSVLLLISGLSASTDNGALAGRVCDALSGEPLGGAVVMVGGNTHFGVVVDLKGNYLMPTLPETAGTVVGADVGYDAISVTYSAAAGCTTRMDFYLYRTPLMSLAQSQSAESLLRVRGMDAIHVDTVAVPLSTGDRAALARSNRVRRALLERYLKGGGYRAALTLEPWRPFPRHSDDRTMTPSGDLEPPGSVQRREREVAPIVVPGRPYILRPNAMVASGKGLCFYRKYNPRGEAYARWSQATHQVTSVTAGYLRIEPDGRPDFVPCGGKYPKDKWLVLKLTLLNGGTVFF